MTSPPTVSRETRAPLSVREIEVVLLATRLLEIRAKTTHAHLALATPADRSRYLLAARACLNVLDALFTGEIGGSK
jgi:hypothetical protein